MVLSNWYCPKCKKQVPSVEIMGREHIECGSRVERQHYLATLLQVPLKEVGEETT